MILGINTDKHINYYLYQHQTSGVGYVYKAITLLRERKDKNYIFKIVAEQMTKEGKNISFEAIKEMVNLYFDQIKEVTDQGGEIENPLVNFKRKHDEVESAINPDYEGETVMEPGKVMQETIENVQLKKLQPEELHTAIFSFKEIIKAKESIELEQKGLYIIEGNNLIFDLNNEDHGIFIRSLKKQKEFRIDDFELISEDKIVFKVSPDFPDGYYDLNLCLDSDNEEEYAIHSLSEAIHI
jgi:hypothetical protein